MGQFSIGQLKEDKALLLAQRYNVLKERLEEIGASLDECVVTYDDSKKEKVIEIMNELLDIKLP